jgi:type-F conjugative transfer system pilin assembly protein TrbC
MNISHAWNRLAVVLLAALLAGPAAAGELDRDSVNNLMQRKEELLGSLKAPSNSYEEEGKQRASRIMERIDSGAFQDRLRAESERLKATVFQDQLPSSRATPSVPLFAKSSGRMSADERLYIFVSASMPVEALRNYAAAIDRIGDPNVLMVMRGFAGGMKAWGNMLDFSSRVLARDRSCDARKDQCDLYRANLQVDPLLFRRYGVSVVPTVVYARGVQRLDAAMSEGLNDVATVSGFHAIRGDVSLEYLLESIRSETKSASIEAVLAALMRSDREGGEDGGR